MNSKLVVFLNGQSVIEYDRRVRLPGHQRQYLDKMDQDMDSGIRLAGQSVDNPELTQRAQYVAMHLIQGIQTDNEGMIAAMSAYLANRLPDLKQVRALEQGENISIDLIFNESDNNPVAVQFDPKLPNRH